MSPVYLNPQPSSSTIPFLELKGDHQQHSFQVFGHLSHDDLATSSNSSFSYNSLNRHSSEEILSNHSRDEQKEVEKLVVSHEKASDLGQPWSSWLQSTVGDDSRCSYGYSFNLREEAKIETPVNCNDQIDKYSRSKWKPSKVRIMQKMMGTSKNSRDSKLVHDLAKRQNSEGIRVCSDCHTTTTPLWRSGPQGPKSLCNACGIRQRKARRAAMAAATAAGFGNDATTKSISPPVEAPKPKVQVMKPEKSGLAHHDKSHTLPLKKRSKILLDAGSNNNNYNQNNNSHNAKKLCFEDFALSLNKSYLKANAKSSFPSDEEEGAILLMALSCGLACSS